MIVGNYGKWAFLCRLPGDAVAGHNKWSKIKRKKGVADAKRGKLFTRLGREIQIAAREGGDDPNYNAALRQAVNRAMAENMPNDNIDRAIKRGAGLLPGQEIVESTYEGYGPAGVAVIVSCLTDNRNRTVSEVRHAFSKAGSALGENGAVAWNFDRVGLVTVNAELDEESAMELAIEAGAADVREGDDCWEFICDADAVGAVRDGLQDQEVNVQDATLIYEPKNTVPVTGTDAEQILRFISALEDLDDVQDVFANFEIPDEEFERLAQAV